MKKWILFLCMLIISLVVAPQSHVKASINFTDIGNNHRASVEISYLVNKKIVNGVSSTSFSPNREVTRGEAAAMLGRALGMDGTKRSTNFEDVAAGNMASGYIVELTNKKIINGYTDGTFRPKNKLNRGEMAILINRAFDLKGTNSAESAKILMDKGIAQGMSDGSFGSSVDIIRSDFAVFMARAIDPDFRVKKDIPVAAPAEVPAVLPIVTPVETPLFDTTMHVNVGSDSLNLRLTPEVINDPSNVISKIHNGQAVSVAGYTGDWAHIKVDNVIGYVHKAYLQSVKPVAVLPAAPPSAGGSDLTVIVDPGHGGSDPGGVGHGFQEKNVVLNVGRHVKAYFDKTAIIAKMTRDSDIFIPLSTRAKYAQNNDGDVFVSLHTNALNGSANGQETFYYAQTAATNPKVQESRALAIYMQARMQETWSLKNRGVNPFGYGNFAVLRENTVPAALIEMGFIDSTTDIQYIKSEPERERMGKAIFLATLDYFYQYEGRTDVLQYYDAVNASPSKRLH